MKRLAVGCDSLDISGFASLSDLTLKKAQSDLVQDTTGKLSRLRNNVLEARPRGPVLGFLSLGIG
ncbi:MAG: hypothetical protein JRJ65_05590 [Deltaproteobacteria bacterium]|nr:hypothetical protein [Deltaproteobacteria bacterium]